MISKKSSSALVVSAALLLASTGSQAALIAYEGFDIASGSINGLRGSGGGSATWLASTWNNTDNTWSSSSPATLSYGSLVTTAGQGFSSGQGNQQSFRSFGTQSSTGTYWMGFLFNRTSGGTGDSLGISFFDGGGNERSFVGQPGQANYGFLAFFGDYRSTVPVVTGETAFLLARYVMDGDSNNATSTAHYWINPDISSQPTNAAAANGPGGTNFRAFGFDKIRLGSFGSQGVIDEIRIGTTFGDVAPIPEPSAALLGALGGLILLRRRRA